MSRFNKFFRPPPPQEVDLHEIWAAIQLEAVRQFDLFQEDVEAHLEERKLRVMESGICNMVLRGAARVEEDGTVVFWNPVAGEFQEYDEEYNQLMLDFMRDFVGTAG
ncbi:MAG: hypothetical protein Kow00129_10230 [Thermoleophilia bacterium]